MFPSNLIVAYGLTFHVLVYCEYYSHAELRAVLGGYSSEIAALQSCEYGDSKR